MNLNVLLLKIKHKLDVYINLLFSYKKAKQVLDKIINMKENDKVIFLLRNHIGDICYGMASLDAYRRENPGKKVVVIGSDNYSKLINSYKNIDKIVLFPPDNQEYKRMLIFSQFSSLRARGGRTWSL